MIKGKQLLALLVIFFSIPVAVYLVLQKTNFLNRAGGVAANLTIDAGVSFLGPSGVWKNLAQGGEEKGKRMLLPVITQTVALKPEYIRLDHVFDYYDVVTRDGGGNLIFNWGSLDQTLEDIKAIGAKPFLSLSYMPPPLSKSDVVDLPKNWNEWELTVQKLVEHVSGKGGLNLDAVYYEVWNEPDLFGKFKVQGDKNYLDLYAHTVVGVTRAGNVNAFKIGGPATTAFYPNWVEALLKLAGSGVRLDFISWHRYSENLGDYEKDSQDAKSLLAKYPGYENLELLITESGPNSENDVVYDNNVSAIHTIAVSAVLEGNLTRNFSFEIKDGPGSNKLWGRWGIFTNEKFGPPEAKPRSAAFTFLNRMVGAKVNVVGQGSWVKAFAKESAGIVRTLVVNYDPDGTHLEAVPVTYVNLPALNFTFRRTDFSGKVTDLPVATTSASWQTLQEFKPNSAAILEIIPVK